jgi:hypothetical protein
LENFVIITLLPQIFFAGQRYVNFPVEILHNDDIEWHKSFRVILGPEDPTGAGLGDQALATVTILDDGVSGSLVFPAPPMVCWVTVTDYVINGNIYCFEIQ